MDLGPTVTSVPVSRHGSLPSTWGSDYHLRPVGGVSAQCRVEGGYDTPTTDLTTPLPEPLPLRVRHTGTPSVRGRDSSPKRMTTLPVETGDDPL